jgi:hypothetical protein
MHSMKEKNNNMKYIRFIFLTSLLIFTMSGCSIKGHKFTPDFNSINELKDADLKPMNVQNKASGNDEAIGLRAAKMVSPYGGSFSKYLELSLEEELKQAALYNNESNIKISATLLKNDVSIASFSIGEADLSANFIVTKQDKKIYEKVHSIHHEWDSSFVGQIAIENALNNYPIAMQKLIDNFLLDEELKQVLK